MSLGRVDEVMREGLFGRCTKVKVRGLNCYFVRSSPIRSILSWKLIQQLLSVVKVDTVNYN